MRAEVRHHRIISSIISNTVNMGEILIDHLNISPRGGGGGGGGLCVGQARVSFRVYVSKLYEKNISKMMYGSMYKYIQTVLRIITCVVDEDNFKCQV